MFISNRGTPKTREGSPYGELAPCLTRPTMGRFSRHDVAKTVAKKPVKKPYMTVEECIRQIEVVNLELAKEKNAFDRWGLYVLKSNFTDHLIKLIKETEDENWLNILYSNQSKNIGKTGIASLQE